MYLFTRDTSKFRYRTWREEERKREHSVGINDKLPKHANVSLHS